MSLKTPRGETDFEDSLQPISPGQWTSGHGRGIVSAMLINRWTGQSLPAPQQLKMLLVNEGLAPELESLPAHSNIKDHRHPFDEVRIILEGNLIMDVNGNQLLLRPGDRIDIPANTKHSKIVHGGSACISLIAKRTF